MRSIMSTGAPTDHVRTAVQQRMVEAAGRTRTFTVVTTSTAPTPGAALVLVFHGVTQNAATVREASGRTFDALTAGGDVVVAYLDGYCKAWNDARLSGDFAARREGVDDVAFTEAVIDALVVDLHVDPERVYAVGFSNGGQMVIRLIHQIPARLAGAAIISATQPSEDNFALPTKPAVPMPVVLIHGTKDPIAPYEGGTGPVVWEILKALKLRESSVWCIRKRGAYRSAQATAEYYAARNGITAAPTSTRLPHQPESGRTRVVRSDFRQNGRAPVTLFTVEGGGHAIPNPKRVPRILGRTTHDLVAADEIAKFFALLPVVDPLRDMPGEGLADG
jgi:polyhydroxybutyrate depolymerase